MKPKWQRARLLTEVCRDSSTKGNEIWIEIGRPATLATVGVISRKVRRVDCYPTSLLDADGRQCVCSARTVELLARNESDFAENVPLMSWKQFVAECASRPADSQTTRLPE